MIQLADIINFTERQEQFQETKLNTDSAVERARGFLAARHLPADEISAAADALSKEIEAGLRACESPIERHLLPWLLIEDYSPLQRGFIPVHLTSDALAPAHKVFLAPQFVIARFRLDFAIVARFRGHAKILAVECDGADFHNRFDDDLRDGYLASFGVETFRATGSEIMSAPFTVAREAAHRIAQWGSEAMS